MLEDSEQVHHIDGDRTNNAVENLVVTTIGEHRRWHASLTACAAELIHLGVLAFDPGCGYFVPQSGRASVATVATVGVRSGSAGNERSGSVRLNRAV